MARRYITATEFNDFGVNQGKLIGILNHNMTKITTDISWLKKLVGWQVGLISSIVAGIIVGIIIIICNSGGA